MNFNRWLTILLVFLILANLGFSGFLFLEQGNIYNEVKVLEKNQGAMQEALATVGQSLGETVTQLSVREEVALERRNSIKVNQANFGENILEVSYKLGSDLSSVTQVFQDWGDHTQKPKVDAIPFQAEGRGLSFEFTPVPDPQTGSVIVVIQAHSATMDKDIQVETNFDLKNRKVTQSGDYTKEPL